MSSESLIKSGEENQLSRFNQRTAAPFVEKSISPETRRLYHRVIREFFAFVRLKHESGVTPDDVLRWRDDLMKKGRKASTVSLKLSIVRSFFEYLKAYGYVALNPASTKLVPPPPVPEAPAGRALVAKEVRYLFASPDRTRPAGARDYAIILIMGRMSLRVSEVAALKTSSITWSHGRSIIKFKVKGGRERTLPLPPDVKNAIDDYLKLDRQRRNILNTGGPDSWIFQPHTNARTLVYNKPLSTRMIAKVVKKYADFAGLGDLSPHDLRRTAITRALDLGESIREVQMMSGHRDVRSLMKYDHGRENIEKNPVNRLHYDD
ncbi:MAG: tyrosine-type recombinase/integrase [Blastocatellia bacterium]